MQPRILLVDDEAEFAQVVADHLRDQGYTVECEGTGVAALERLHREEFDLALLDVRMPGLDGLSVLERLKEDGWGGEVVMLTAHAAVEDAVRAIKMGALDYLGKPARLSEVDAVVQKALEVRALRREARQWRESANRAMGYPEVVGDSPGMRAVLARVAQIGPTDVTVLIEGETGVGKEVVARAIHRASMRAEMPFVVVDCSALQPAVVESELFGHEKGAFTGAHTRRLGLAEVADRGTLFVDEVGEMSADVQARFLRVLETKEFRRVGGTQMSRADVRVIAATRRSLEEEIRHGRFRDDLFYRLNVFRIKIPPLRERKEDLRALAEHFLARAARGGAVAQFEDEAWKALAEHGWPGNVRELANVLECAVVTARNGWIRREDLALPRGVRAAGATTGAVPVGRLSDVERDQISRALEQTGGNKAAAARVLGISLRNLYRKLERHGLDTGAPK